VIRTKVGRKSHTLELRGARRIERERERESEREREGDREREIGASE